MMEQWLQIRRRVLREGVSKRQILKETGMHWTTLERVLSNPTPPGYCRSKPTYSKIDPYRQRIREILQQDRFVPKKQRHTAHRIWQILQAEGFTGGYTIVKDAVRQIKRTGQEVFMPLVHPPGEAQIDGCRFTTWSEIQASKVHKFLADLRAKGLSIQSSNFYLQSIRQLGKWMVQDGRASHSPVEHLKGLNVRVDRRHDRRALEPDEVRRLLETTPAGPVSYGMSGYERYLIYYLAATTGLRANEVRGLKVKDFHLDGMSVMVRARYAKNRREDTLPLRPELVSMLKEFFRGKLPNTRAFGGTCKQLTKRTADMLKADLATAGIPYVDDSGRYADFHSSRHTTGSLLAASGITSKSCTIDYEA